MPLYRSAGKYDWLAGPIKLAVLSNAYTPSFNHLVFSDVNSAEVSGTGYTAGGTTLAGRVFAWDPLLLRHTLDADDYLLLNVTFTNGRYALIYSDTGTPSTSPLIGYVDLGADFSPANAAFKVQWHPTGIFFDRLGE